MSKLRTAIQLALTSHGDQLDKSGRLYVTHPLRVMSRFMTSPESYQIIAVLHDIVEDTSVTLQDIRIEFGTEIAEAVDALSRRDRETYTKFITRVAANKYARAIKFADIQDNINPDRGYHSLSLIDRYIKAHDYLLEVIFKENDEDEISFLNAKGLLALANFGDEA